MENSRQIQRKIIPDGYFVLAHNRLRIRYLLAEPEPLIVGYDQDAWARLFDYHAQPLEASLADSLDPRLPSVIPPG